MADGTTKSIENINSGERIGTRHGSRKVMWAGVSSNPNGCVTIKAGHIKLTGTTDHPILVSGSWVPMGDIKIGDELCTASYTQELHGTKNHQDTYTTSAEGTFIDLCGLKLMGALRRAWLFTMLMVTHPIITLQTLQSCLSQNTNASTRLADQHRIIKRGWLESLFVLSGLKSLVSACSARLHSLLKPSMRLDAFALQSVARNGEEMHFNQRLGDAQHAEVNTQPSNHSKSIVPSHVVVSPPLELSASLGSVRVDSVELSPHTTTYNLTVEGEHEYIANGIVVHNCWADELAAFQYINEGEAWDMMMMGLRLGEKPRVIVTTTPKHRDLIVNLISREGDDVVIDRASTYGNIDNLSSTFSKQLEQYKGSKLYDQEVLGLLIDLEDGKVVSRDMFKLWPANKAFPAFEYIVQSYDCAFSEKLHNDPTAMTTWGVFKPLDGPLAVLLIDCWAEHLTFPLLKPKVISEFSVVYGEGEEARKPDIILVEDKASGISLIQELRHAHLPVRGWNPGRADKMQRLQITASIFTSGRVWLPESSIRKGYVKDWAEGFLSQLCAFPDATHDDYVDSASMAIRFLKDTGWLDINPEPMYDDDDDYKPKRVNPYSV